MCAWWERWKNYMQNHSYPAHVGNMSEAGDKDAQIFKTRFEVVSFVYAHETIYCWHHQYATCCMHCLDLITKHGIRHCVHNLILFLSIENSIKLNDASNDDDVDADAALNCLVEIIMRPELAFANLFTSWTPVWASLCLARQVKLTICSWINLKPIFLEGEGLEGWRK